MIKKIFFCCSLIIIVTYCPAQVLAPQGVIGIDDDLSRVINTAVPFLLISPDARSAGMGDIGVATQPDATAIYWNPGKLTFANNEAGINLSYTPWLSRIVPDMSISNISTFMKLNKSQAVGFELRYFDMGDVTFKSNYGVLLGNFSPREFALALSFSQALVEDKFGIGLSARYINSDLSGNILQNSNPDVRPGQSVAADLGLYFKNTYLNNGNKRDLAFGLALTNMGAKIYYSDNNHEQFLPTNLRLGSAYTYHVDPFNSFTFALDLSKLMVPTPPQYQLDSNRNLVYNQNGQPAVARGKSPDRPLLQGMFSSFADAPNGLREELQEIMIALGIEYWYEQKLAFRTGFFHESNFKGGRRYLAFGTGFRYQVFGLDIAYLVPFAVDHPLSETLRVSLIFDWNNLSSPSATHSGITSAQNE
ncbi:MAG: type IX secretion system outer membrane channel protein PorV [Cyclobacteriaceae bacterium]